jgi:hypothetical protein
MNKPAIPGLRFRHVLAGALKPGDILSTPGGWATVTARTGVQDGIGGTYIAATVALMHDPSATREQRYDAGSVVPVLRPDSAMPEPGTRVRTPFGIGSVVQPDGVAVVCYDVPARPLLVKYGLVPADKIQVIEARTAATTPATASRDGGAS